MTLRWQRLLSIVLSVAILFSFLSWNSVVLAEGEISSVQVSCLGHSLSLDGKIGINFYYRFSEELLNNESAVVRFTYADSRTETIYLRAGDPQPGGVYIYSAFVAAKEMADVVTAEVIANGQVIDTTTYSANQYYAELMNNETYRNNGALRTIVVYMLMYGNAAQNYFEYNLENLAIDSEHLPEVEFDLSPEDIDDYLSSYDSYNVALGDDYIHFAGSDLTIESTTTMGLYFEVTSMEYSYEDIRVNVDGEELGQGDGNSLVEIDGKWYLYVTVSDIDARNISSTHNVKIYLFGNENPSVDVNYSPLAYCRLVRKNNDCSEELRELALRFTEYSIAVYGYLDSIGDSSPVPTNTPTPTATSTPVPTATNTPVPTATNTPVPTSTPAPTATNTPVPTTPTPLPSEHVDIPSYPYDCSMTVGYIIGCDRNLITCFTRRGYACTTKAYQGMTVYELVLSQYGRSYEDLADLMAAINDYALSH